MARLTKERVTHAVTPLQTLYETHPETPFVQVSKTKSKTKYLLLTFQPYRASKKDWAAFRRRRHLTNTRRSQKMSQKFDEHDANDLSRIIRRRRPHWNHNGIMGFLQQAALRGASLAQVMSAAEKTWNNQKATTPAAIMWAEHWAPDNHKGSQAAGNIMAPRLCVECTAKRPVTEMTKQPHGWVCNNHQEGQ